MRMAVRCQPEFNPPGDGVGETGFYLLFQFAPVHWDVLVFNLLSQLHSSLGFNVIAQRKDIVYVPLHVLRCKDRLMRPLCA